MESITDFLKRIVAAEIPFVKKFKKVIGVTDFLRVGIAVQRDDISILVDNDTKSFAPKQVIKHQVVECGNIVGSPKKSDDGIIVQDRNSENDSGLVVDTALYWIAQNALTGNAFLEIIAVGNVFYVSIFIMRSAVWFDQSDVVDGSGGLDGGKHILVFLGEKNTIFSNLCGNSIQKLVVDVQNIFKMYALPGNVHHQF